MIGLKQINNEKVKPIKLPVVDITKIKGHKLFEEPYANIFLLAKKKSGKTNAIFKILKESASKNTEIIIFSSTVNKDQNWIHIIAYLKKKNRIVETFTSIKEGKKNNHLLEILKDFQLDGEEQTKQQEEIKPKIRYIKVDNDEDDEQEESRKPRKLSPEYIFVFDDIGNELQDKYVNQLLKTNRHYKSKVIISSQYLNDLTPQARKQIDYMLIFKGQPQEKLKTIHEDLDLSLEFPTFLAIYNSATEQKYCFLYIDVRNEKYRNCFDKQYEIE